MHAAGQGRNPQAHRNKVQEDSQNNQGDHDDYNQEDRVILRAVSAWTGGLCKACGGNGQHQDRQKCEKTF